MKKRTLALAIAAAMVSPSAFAAEDTSGMHFTSASEGFYASMRSRLDFSTGDDGTANLDASGSRFGFSGTNDLGGGLTGFYGWEAEVRTDDGSRGSNTDGTNNPIRIRLGNVGLRGDFGELAIGSFWTSDYSFTHGVSDIANNYSGWLTYNDQREGRSEKAVQYTTPDLNGFQGAIRVDVGSNDNTVAASNGADATADTADDVAGRSDSDIDSWNLAAQYNVQGFSVGASYNNRPDGLPMNNDGAVGDNGGYTGYDDATSWTVKTRYGQDNWYVGGWYGEDNTSDNGVAGSDDTEYFSVAGGVSVDKVNLYVLYEQRETKASAAAALEDAYGTIGVQYNLGAQSRVWVEYWSRDLDGSPDAEDRISVGMRHDF